MSDVESSAGWLGSDSSDDWLGDSDASVHQDEARVEDELFDFGDISDAPASLDSGMVIYTSSDTASASVAPESLVHTMAGCEVFFDSSTDYLLSIKCACQFVYHAIC